MSERQAEAAKRRWSALSVEERRQATRPAIDAELDRRNRVNKVMNCFEDALLAAGLRLTPIDDTDGDS